MSEELPATKGVIKFSKRKQDKLGIVGPNEDRTDGSDGSEYHVYEHYGKSVRYDEYTQQPNSRNSTKNITVWEVS